MRPASSPEPEGETTPNHPASVGKKVRRRRKQLGMSLHQLAKDAGLTASFLSLVENGKSNPSVESLRYISAALGVAPFYFLLDDSESEPVVRRTERILVTPPGYNQPDELLSHDLNRKMEVFIARLAPGESNTDELQSHPSEEVVLVLQGQMRLSLGGAEHVLDIGDSAYIDGPTPHRITAAGHEELVWYAVVNPPVF